MITHGKVIDGVIVPDGGISLPEGADVTISYAEMVSPTNGRNRRIQLPVIPSERPGSVSLTAERVAELLDEADVPA